MTPNDPGSLAALSATEVSARLRDGAFSTSDYCQALLARVDAVEPLVLAWQHLDRDDLLLQAGRADEAHAQRLADGPLHGLPVGLKDIIDTAGMPTENGTVLHAGRVPLHDATLVSRLRGAGALIMGKTVTTELATYAPGVTRNPNHPEHTPGGSSSGSAAAVAAGMVPLAIGTQTNGSVIRPASFCGVYGYKPGAGLISRAGVLTQSPSFDAIGVFGRTLADVALLAQAIAGHDEADPATLLRPVPPLLRTLASEVPLPPTLAWVPTPFFERLASDAQAAFGELVELLGHQAPRFELPFDAAAVVAQHKLAMEVEIADSFEREYERGRDRLSGLLQAQIERGRSASAIDYRRALAPIPRLLEAIDEIFDHCDAILTPASLGTAPRGLETTGDPLMCTLWTYLGMPALSLPLLHGENGLPLGVQLVGRRGDDARLLRTARWLVERVEQA